jgi:Dyp-type peroxidase family
VGNHHPEVLDRADIQGLVLRAYAELPLARYAFLHIVDIRTFGQWLGQRIASGHVTAGARRPADPGAAAFNIAFSVPGLRKLGVDPDPAPGGYDGFGLEFREGMIHPVRSRILGDVGPNDPREWAWGGPGGDASYGALDCVCLVFTKRPRGTAGGESPLDRAWASLDGDNSGARVVYHLDAALTPDGREHFGFKDGISQPVIRFTKRDYGLEETERALHVVEPGEFILGYENENGRMPITPSISSDRDKGNHLGPLAGSARWRARYGLQHARDLGRNGTFLVVRQLQQHVQAFRQFVRTNAGPDEACQKHLAARLIGRWPNGTPLVLSPERESPMAEDELNDFGYFAQDRFGYRCPLGAHIRRGNPRDSSADVDGQAHALRRVRFHRLLRRGRVYGRPVPGDDPQHPDYGADRGLMFICLNTDLRRQFEFVQQTWMYERSFAGLPGDRDPLTSGGGDFTIQRPDGPERVRGLEQFVTVRGGGYFFMPGLRALRCLAGAE